MKKYRKTGSLLRIYDEGVAMKPNGRDLLAILIDLLAEQEGVSIGYVITERN